MVLNSLHYMCNEISVDNDYIYLILNYMRVLLLHIFCPMLSFGQLTIQNNLLATAGELQSNGTIQVEYSLGEVFTASIDDGTYLLTQGFNQPPRKRKISPSADVDAFISLDEVGEEAFKIYPNPTFDFLTIQAINFENVRIELIDMSGRMVHNYLLNQAVNKIDLRPFEDGTYQLIIHSS